MASRGSDLLDQFKIATELRLDCTVHTFFRSDPARQSRRTQATQEWLRVKPIGRGSFGVVYLEREKQGELRAVKKVSKSGRERDDEYSLRELLSLATISKDHINFPKFYGWYDDTEHIYISMEYFPLGDLREYRSHCEQAISDFEARLICFQLAEALEAIHYHSITHRDLKPNNVFVVREGPDWWVKLGDFGMAKRVRNEDTALHTILAGVYVAPEILGLVDSDDDTEKVYGSAVDIWSLGCVAYWVLIGIDLFSPQTLRRYCQTSVLPNEALYKISDNQECLSFVLSCLEMEPDTRPTINQILDLSWLRDRNNKSAKKNTPAADAQSRSGAEMRYSGVYIINETIANFISNDTEFSRILFTNKDLAGVPYREELVYLEENTEDTVICAATSGVPRSYHKCDLSILQPRLWCGSTTTRIPEGFLHKCSQDTIIIESHDGELISLQPSKLSAADVRYLSAWSGNADYLIKLGAPDPNTWNSEQGFFMLGSGSETWFKGPADVTGQRPFRSVRLDGSFTFLRFDSGFVKIRDSQHDISTIPVEWVSWETMRSVKHKIESLPEMQLHNYLFPPRLEETEGRFYGPFDEGFGYSYKARSTIINGFDQTSVYTTIQARSFWLLNGRQRAMFLTSLDNLVEDLKKYQASHPLPLNGRLFIGAYVGHVTILNICSLYIYYLEGGQELLVRGIQGAKTDFLLSLQRLNFEDLKRRHAFRQWDRSGVDKELLRRFRLGIDKELFTQGFKLGNDKALFTQGFNT